MPCGATGEGREGPGHYLPHHCHNNHHGGKGGGGRTHVHHHDDRHQVVTPWVGVGAPLKEDRPMGREVRYRPDLPNIFSNHKLYKMFNGRKSHTKKSLLLKLHIEPCIYKHIHMYYTICIN